MGAFRVFILLICLTSFACAQDNLKSTDMHLEFINNKLAGNTFTKKQPGRMSALGGSIIGYYWKNKLMLITTHYGGEFGYIEHSFYIKNDTTVVFVNEKKVILKEPETEKEYAEFEKYLIFHTDKDGNKDLTKWPLTINISNDYYLENARIVKYQLKNFDKPVKARENEIEETTKDLIYRYSTYLEELK